MAMIRPETEMKDSGIEYVGAIPKDWDLVRLRAYFGERKNKNKDGNETNLLSLSYGRIIRKNIDKTDGLLPASFNTYNIVEKNDIIIRPTDLQNDKRSLRTGLVTEHGIITSAYIDLMPIGNVDSRFVHYLLHSYDILKVFYNMGSGVRQGLNYSEFSKLKVPMPPLSEQQAIANYLDETCSKIDEIIAEAKASIDEYKTLKQALIAEITTNGLNKNIDFCETNFAWMGKIPSHWELKPFKYVLNERNEKNNPIKSTERLSLSIDKGITLYAEKTTNLDRFKDDFTAYKLAYKGDLVMNSMNMIVGASGVSDYFGCVSPVYYTYFDNEPDHITAKYCEYLFRSRMLMRVLRSLGRGIHHIDRGDDRVNTCRLKVSRDDLRTLVLPVPPICEQRDIVSFLDKRTAEIDSLIAEKESLIHDLEAYKKSLIYEVVTGKRRVV